MALPSSKAIENGFSSAVGYAAQGKRPSRLSRASIRTNSLAFIFIIIAIP